MLQLRPVLKNSIRVLPYVQPMSTIPTPQVDLSVDQDGIATLTLQRPPVNSLNLDLVLEINKSLDEIAKNKYKGMILTSASPGVFSAGIDLAEAYRPERAKVEHYWTTMQDVWIKLFSSDCITTAAINGHSPAGGCLLAMSCEYRAMVDGFRIGLNETAIGMVPATWFIDSMLNTISRREAEQALTSAKLYKAEEAYKVGLVDDLVADKEEAVEKCRQFIKKFDKIPSFARVLTKQKVREGPLKRLIDNRKLDLDTTTNHLLEERTQQEIETYLKRLSSKAK
ncbi:enoyl-CoA delta isomerase 1, mitochondrial-like [Pectinophora gossypiella]|uniref:enoyl-CoA delta isomerase 1, mitochondrial-like n=1 Tax=Pectinophora gossypiella TaxID=13191 RepID=UPI00214E4ED0|nr:enoyl-CoA delta isomerase 1, mitochondrial-like [Pectinophora gossypiella]XP_049874319.1 enoyl-CoA delta isomerase 1, mitochondrial-like [Pectinophora gossypiella]